ncbi:carbamate kinase [Calorimonas adulescens]|uniref:Carbamate kinase n=1 Tax=Calorimonas adulescens TaxID=2606906 RepID=A0A5D8QEI9_9THEO|nr:carbamate kinase [Calorimonas adulescens]TZE82922.1 carbamate kinase [Calorimonas adulescens]
MSRIVVALGGNALQSNPKDVSAESQLASCRLTAKAIVSLVKEGHEVIVAHGNGPQVGQIVSTYETASKTAGGYVMPLPECGSMSQGYIGYHLQQSIGDALRKEGINRSVATVITQVVVDRDDPAFQNPSKPIGSFFTKEEAYKLVAMENGYVMKEDAGRGYRRVVPSPMPKRIVEENIVRTLAEAGHIVISCGGGGVPVIEDEDGLKGVAAVIDKDLASEKLAEIMDADVLLILTAVEKVAINYNRPGQKDLDTLTAEEAEGYMREGHFAPGSMLPKVQAAVMFARSGPGRKAIITSLEKAEDAIQGKTGTVVTN